MRDILDMLEELRERKQRWRNQWKVIDCNQPQWDFVIRWCLEEVLQMKSYDLEIQCIKKYTYRGLFSPPASIIINSLQSIDGIYTTLFHELRHYYQYVTKMFVFNFKDYIVYSNRDGDIDYDTTYSQFPWEIDARAFARQTFDRYRASYPVNQSRENRKKRFKK